MPQVRVLSSRPKPPQLSFEGRGGFLSGMIDGRECGKIAEAQRLKEKQRTTGRKNAVVGNLKASEACAAAVRVLTGEIVPTHCVKA